MNALPFDQYLRSFSTRLGFCVGAIMYLSYGYALRAWQNPALIIVSITVAFLIPFYSRMSNRAEEWIGFKTAVITYGRAGRFALQFLFNYAIFCIFEMGGILPRHNLHGLGGVIGITCLTTMASQGLQYLALAMANREIGNKNLNILLALSVNVLITAVATVGLPIAKEIFLIYGITTGCGFVTISLLSDLRAYFYPKSGIGIFFGTFNPMHTTHLRLIRETIEKRNLKRVFIHATVVPKLHRDALAKNEIEIKEFRDGMRIYQKTPSADVHVNYFPTGNRFFEFETRCRLMELAIREAGLDSQVTILSKPELYEADGFYGIIREIKAAHPAEPIHGIHGSDIGGMWVRSIYDESGWIYPAPFRRQDNVSATAIRNGAPGMTTQYVADILSQLKAGATSFIVGNLKFSFDKGVLNYER